MRILLLLAAASLLTIPAVAADHDGESPADCEGEPNNKFCFDYCIHGTGINYRISTRDPTDVQRDDCWIM